MPQKIRTFLVTMPQDTNNAASVGLPSVYLYYQINTEGQLIRSAPISMKGGVMGIYTDGQDCSHVDMGRLGKELIAEYQKQGFIGVLLDMDGANDAALVSGLSKLLYSRGIVHFIPLSMAQASSQAKLIITSAVSGGSYQEMLTGYAGRYGANRLCLELVRTCSDFLMPSYSPEGTLLSPAQFREIIETYYPSVYFSQELCAKYCTYRKNEENHFLLFDDASSAAQKLNIAAKQGFFAAFMLYRDWGPDARTIAFR